MNRLRIVLLALFVWSISPFFCAAKTLDDLNKNWSKGAKLYVRMLGSDLLHDGKSPNKAFRTLSRALKVAGPGTTIFVGAGIYSELDTITIANVNGTAAKPLVIYADKTGKYTGDAGEVTLVSLLLKSDYVWKINSSKYVIVSGFKFVENPLALVTDFSKVTSDALNVLYQAALNKFIWAHGLQVNTSNNVIVHDCQFLRYRHALTISASANCQVWDSTFKDTRWVQLYGLDSTKLLVQACTFTMPDSPTTGNTASSIYNWNTQLTVEGCTFDSAGNLLSSTVKSLAELTGLSTYLYRYSYHIWSHGLGEAKGKAANLGELTVNNCTFKNATYISVYTEWMKTFTLTNSTLTNCRYGVQAHSENSTLRDLKVAHPKDTEWNLQDSWGIYVNAYSVPTNFQFDNTRRQDAKSPGAAIKNITLDNQRRGLLIGSDNVTLDTVAINGNTAFDGDPKNGKWKAYSQGIELGWNCSKMTFTDKQKLTFKNQWWAIVNNGNANGLACTFNNFVLSKQWNGVYHQNAKVTYTNTQITDNILHGAAHWDIDSLTATNSKFNNNATMNWYGWGLYVYGKKIPRKPQPADPINNPGWDAHTEIDLFGKYGKSTLNLSNCTFNDNGEYAVGGEGGLFISRFQKANIKLSKNQVNNNHWTGVALVDCDIALNKNAEFSKISGNWHGISAWGYFEEQTGSTAISNYDITANNHGLVFWDTKATVSKTRSHHNKDYGLYAWSSQLTLDTVTCDFNKQGFMLDRNSHHDIKKCQALDNTEHGVWWQITTLWPQTDAYKTRESLQTFKLDQLTCNRNGYGLSLQSVVHDDDAAIYPDNYTFPLKNVTCNQNKNRGLWLAYGWLDTKLKPLNIVCNNNGYVVANSNNFGTGDRYGTGMEFYYPQRDVTLDNTLGLSANNNFDTGIKFVNTAWIWNPKTQTSPVHWLPCNLTVRNWTGSVGNGNWCVAASEYKDVTVENVTAEGGLIASQPQGKVLVKNAKFSKGQHGFSTAWGWYEDWQANSAPGVKWRAPESVTIENSQFTNNRWSGIYADSYTRWQTSDRRSPFTVTNCKTNDNGWRGVDIACLDASLTNHQANGNKFSGAMVWNGNATIQAGEFSNNCFGRWPDASGKLVRQSWVALELNNPYDDKRQFTYTVRDCTLNNNDGLGIFLHCKDGTALVENCSVNSVLYGTGIQGHYLTSAKVLNSTVQAVKENWGVYFDMVQKLNLENVTAANCRYGILGFGRREQLGSLWVATDNSTAELKNCKSNDHQFDGSSHGIYTAYNNSTVTGCQTARNKGYGIVLTDQTGASVENNTILSNEYIGLRVDSVGLANVRNNVIAKNGYGFGTYNNGFGLALWNNTIADNTNWGVYASTGKLALHNNIVSNNGQWGVYLESPVAYTGTHNLTFRHVAAHYRHPSLAADVMKGKTGLVKPPRFVNAATGDYHLASGSPAINAGTPNPLATVDQEGRARGTFRGWELGAMEYTNAEGSLRILEWDEKK